MAGRCISHSAGPHLEGEAPKVARKTHAPQSALSEIQTGVTKVTWLVRLSLSNRPRRRSHFGASGDGALEAQPVRRGRGSREAKWQGWRSQGTGGRESWQAGAKQRGSGRRYSPGRPEEDLSGHLQ